MNFLNENLQCCEHHKQNSIHRHSIGVAAEIPEAAISQPGQIKPKLSAWLETPEGAVCKKIHLFLFWIKVSFCFQHFYSFISSFTVVNDGILEQSMINLQLELILINKTLPWLLYMSSWLIVLSAETISSVQSFLCLC